MSKVDINTITDEDVLHKMLSTTEDFDERRKIRSRLKEVREKARVEYEERRKQRDAEAGDVVKKQFERAEELKRKKMAAYQEAGAKPTAERESDYLKSSEKTLQDMHRQADEDKKKRLEAYSKISVQHGTSTGASSADGAKVSSSTTVTTDGSKTTTTKTTETTVTKTSGAGGMQYGTPGRSGAAKPAGARGAMAAFKQMDNTNNPQSANKPKGMARSPSAIKQMLLDWCKAKTTEYENIEITNFSSSWNNGMAFCALIHHFFPDAFDYSKLEPKNRRYNFTLAFDTAEKQADISPLLDVDDMVKMKNPDWKCVFCYVQSLYRHLHTHDANKAKETAEQ